MKDHPFLPTFRGATATDIDLYPHVEGDVREEILCREARVAVVDASAAFHAYEADRFGEGKYQAYLLANDRADDACRAVTAFRVERCHAGRQDREWAGAA
jgi:hypothetical protein